MKWYVLLGLFMAQNACNSSSSSIPVAPVVAPAPVIDSSLMALAVAYDSWIEAGVKLSPGAGAAVAIVKDSQVILLKGYGFRNAANKERVDEHTVFRIGSLSKGFTAVLAGILVQEGQLHWNDKVSRLLPWFHLKNKEQTRRLELWHLLSHTTGLPYHAFTNLIEDGMGIQDIAIHYFPKSPVCGKEGEFYAYQNAAFCLSGKMMEAATHTSFDQLLEAKILAPGGLKDASCSFSAISCNTDKALPHLWTGNTWVPGAIEDSYYNAAEAGGINASISDMSRWLEILLGMHPEIIATETLDKVFQPVVKTGNERRIQRGWTSREEASYALGWRVIEQAKDTIIYHGGAVNGFRSEIALNRRDGIGICVLFNGNIQPLDRDCIQAFFDIWEEINLKRF